MSFSKFWFHALLTVGAVALLLVLTGKVSWPSILWFFVAWGFVLQGSAIIFVASAAGVLVIYKKSED